MSAAARSAADTGAGAGIEVLLERLFDPPTIGTWAVLDGASVPGLVRAIHTHGAESACLFAGKLEPSMARVAPYLVRLEEDASFTRWLLERGWGRHWGVFLRSAASLDALRKHLRRFLMVKDPAGKTVQFRWYDPRVLRIYLPTCIEVEVEALFGSVVASYGVESEDAQELLVFTPDAAPPRLEALALAKPRS